MDACDESFEITERITSTGEDRPSIYSRGSNQYIVNFASGTQVQAHVWGNNMNVYIDIPGIYWQNVGGMCGNFDGNSNNEGNPSYVIGSYSSLPNEWKVNPSESLWIWEPSENIDNSEITLHIPPNSHTCEYTRPLHGKPIISNANVEDITDLIISTRQQNSDNLQHNIVKNYTFIPSSGETESDPTQSISEDMARGLCAERIYLSEAGERCNDISNIDLGIFMNNCVEDLTLMGNEQYIDNAYNDMINACELEIYSNLSNWGTSVSGLSYTAPLDIIQNLCIDGCSRNGRCLNGECVCREGYGGSNCMVDLNREPLVNSVYPYACDFNHPEDCGNYIRINGDNYLNSTGLTCQYKTYFGNYSRVWNVPAKYMGYSMVMCPTPLNHTIQLNENYGLIINIGISNSEYNGADGLLGQTQEYFYETYSEYLDRISNNSVDFIWYDFCHRCDNRGECEFREDTCNMLDSNSNNDMPRWMTHKCIREDETSIGNVCKQCVPSINRTGWSYNIDSLMCQPRLKYREYNVHIAEGIYYNETIILEIFNNLVPRELYNVTFDYVGEYSFTGINNISGELSISGLFDYEERQMYDIPILIKDNDIILDTSILIIDIIDINETPVLSRDEFSFNVSYDLTQHQLHYDDMVIVATDPDILSDSSLKWDKLIYTISDTHRDYQNLFIIDQHNGTISINDREMFRYLNDHLEQLQTSIAFDILVRIEDGGNEAFETNVRLNFVSSNYEWVVNTSTAEILNTPDTSDITEITDSINADTNLSNIYNLETEFIDTTSRSKINLTLETTTEPTITYIEYNFTDELLSQASDTLSKTDSSIIIVICISLLMLIFIIIIIVNHYRKYYTHNSKVDMNRNMITNPIYSGLIQIKPELKAKYETISETKSSLLNYSWYRSSLEDLECQNLLQHKGQGAFIVSNYSGEVNNYFFIIKNDNRLVKQDIVYNKQGFSLYGVINAPSFISLPDLVEYYSTPRKDFIFKLIDGLPDYDNAHLQSSTINCSPYIKRNRYGIDGPSLPIKNKDK